MKLLPLGYLTSINAEDAEIFQQHKNYWFDKERITCDDYQLILFISYENFIINNYAT
jgi:hypothetical protein